MLLAPLEWHRQLALLLRKASVILVGSFTSAKTITTAFMAKI